MPSTLDPLIAHTIPFVVLFDEIDGVVPGLKLTVFPEGSWLLIVGPEQTGGLPDVQEDCTAYWLNGPPTEA